MEYRRNWDKLTATFRLHPSVLHSIEDLTDPATITEPVTLQELKAYMRLDAFASVEAVEDGLLLSLLAEARGLLEQASQASIVAHTYRVTFSSWNGTFTLPYTAFSIGSITYADGGIVSDFVLSGSQLSMVWGENMVVEYTTKPLPVFRTRMSILRMTAYLYENRGDETGKGIWDKAVDYSNPYSQASWLL